MAKENRFDVIILLVLFMNQLFFTIIMLEQLLQSDRRSVSYKKQLI